MNKKNDQYFVATLWIILGALSRILPHPANITPFTSLGLFGGTHLPSRLSYFITFASLVISDALIAWIGGYPIFGAWSIFTYSGFAAIVFAGSFLRNSPTAGRTLAFLLGSTLAFWIWTNFGVWISGEANLYPRTLEGLVACYIAAIPFLRNSLMGDLAWGLLFFLSFASIRKLAPKLGLQVQGA